MKILKTYFITFIIFFGFSVQSSSKNVPESFADLAEKLMPSVVNISTTQTVVTNSNPFPVPVICMSAVRVHVPPSGPNVVSTQVPT